MLLLPRFRYHDVSGGDNLIFKVEARSHHPLKVHHEIRFRFFFYK